MDYAGHALDGFVESPRRGDVGDDGEGEERAVLRVGSADFISSGFGADSAADVVAVGEKGIEDVGSDEAGGACQKDWGAVFLRRGAGDSRDRALDCVHLGKGICWMLGIWRYQIEVRMRV